MTNHINLKASVIGEFIDHIALGENPDERMLDKFMEQISAYFACAPVAHGMGYYITRHRMGDPNDEACFGFYDSLEEMLDDYGYLKDERSNYIYTCHDYRDLSF